MSATALHSGLSHPDLGWIVLASLCSFAAGLGVGGFADRIRGWLRARVAPAAE